MYLVDFWLRPDVRSIHYLTMVLLVSFSNLQTRVFGRYFVMDHRESKLIVNQSHQSQLTANSCKAEQPDICNKKASATITHLLPYQEWKHNSGRKMYLNSSNQSDETGLFFMTNDHELQLRPFHVQSSLVKNENSTDRSINKNKNRIRV